MIMTNWQGALVNKVNRKHRTVEYHLKSTSYNMLMSNLWLYAVIVAVNAITRVVLYTALLYNTRRVTISLQLKVHDIVLF